MIKNILLDMDNTILDFTRAERVAASKALAAMEIQPTDELLKRYHEINEDQWRLFELGELEREQVKVRRYELLFDEMGIGYVKGKTWTTDAMYRETMGNRDLRVAEGCVAVDMECAALQAVCDFRGMELYQFFYGADSLAGSKWNARILGNYEISKRMKFFHLALELAKKIDEQ
ncbi:MAG: hypothetical protein IKA58_06575 [Clostridia bacterium]|nr:hypothetical protein [Clostridia bacterium]